MFLSEYVVVNRKGGFPDPLGFMRPAGVFQARLFRQFTVLSNHPAYHGILCAEWKYLHDQGRSPGRTGFSRVNPTPPRPAQDTPPWQNPRRAKPQSEGFPIDLSSTMPESGTPVATTRTRS